MTSFSKNLSACSCIGQRTVEEEIIHSDIVVVGTIISIEEIKIYDTVNIDLEIFHIINRNDLIVNTLYKGNLNTDTVSVFSGSGFGDCGYQFEIGGKYIVYGINYNYQGKTNDNLTNEFFTTICYRTKRYQNEEIFEIEKFVKRKQVEQEKTIVFIDPDIPPVFEDGGDIGLQMFIKQNLRYPKTGECISGKIYVGFTVDINGLVKNTVIKRGITTASNEEAIRIVKLMKFKPGTRNGKPIEVEMIVPISFTIENNNEEE